MGGGLMLRLVRGNAVHGTEITVDFGEMYAFRLVGVDVADEILNMRNCRLCGALVIDADQHADYHFALAAGRPFGVTPPGFTS